MATERFLVFMGVSLLVFGVLIRGVLRRRAVRPAWSRVAWVAGIVVVGGMLFARHAANLGVPPALYYGLPALVTVALPPLAFRMSRSETLHYVLWALAASPAIHLVFSLALGWHEYLPFWHIPALWE